jgi:exodeoxyribonuclease VII large subunit
MPKEQRPYTVSKVVDVWDKELRALGKVQVIGELCAFKVSSNGHAYFTLTDGRSQLSGTLWRDRVRNLTWQPQIGEQVLIEGLGQVYKGRGTAQLEAFSFFPAGSGLQAIALAELERRLAAEGLFDLERKRAIPFFPRRVGVVSSLQADGFADFCRSRVLRAPTIPILVADAPVQGPIAAEALAAALARLDRGGECSVIALVRGGGAASDLLPFSEEVLVRAIAACTTPVVVGIGHEPDHPIAERAADRVAHTPTNAAELIFPDLREEAKKLVVLSSRLQRPISTLFDATRSEKALIRHRLSGALRNRLLDAGRAVSVQQQRLSAAHPQAHLTRKRQELAALGERALRASPRLGLASARGRWETLAGRIDVTGRIHLQTAETQLASLADRLWASSPQAVLQRGFTMVVDEGGRPITSAQQAPVGSVVRLQFGDGQRKARIEED